MEVASDDHKACNYALVPPELLQVVGGQLSSGELRNARLVCTGWAKALAHCMPAVTVALPRQASERIFRQPLVLCSSGVLNSAQCQDYSAVPRSTPHHHSISHLSGRRRSCRHSHDGTSPGCSPTCKRACTGSTCSTSLAASSSAAAAAARSRTEPGSSGPVLPPEEDSQPQPQAADPFSEAQPVSRDKPSPFATELGQAVLECLLEDPLLTAAAAGPKGCPAPAAAAAAGGSGLRGSSAAGGGSSIPRLPRMSAIKAAISMPPTLAEQAAATQQQHAMQPDKSQMRKLSSVPANNAHPVPRTRHVRQLGAGGPVAGTSTSTAQEQGGQQGASHHVVTTVGPAIQGWSSLPSAGLRTCSSLKQLHLKLSGAPPSPADLLDLSKLLHLTHLSFKQVDLPEAEDDDSMPSAVQEDSAELLCSTTDTSRSSSSMMDTTPAAAAAATDPAVAACSSKALDWAADCQGGGGGGGALKRSHSIGPIRLQSCLAGGMPSAGATQAAAAASALEGCHISAAAPLGRLQGTKSAALLGAATVCACACDSDVSMSDAEDAGSGDDDAAAVRRDQGCSVCAEGCVPTQSITCSVISAEHVQALAQLPYLSSLELAPKQGEWDAVSREGLLHLVRLTGLTRLSVTWGDAAAAVAPLSNEAAAAAAQVEQLALQKCLAGLTSLEELCINGVAVVDAAVLQRLQQLRSITAEGLQVVNSDVMSLIDQGEQQQQQQESVSAQQQAGQQALPAQPLLSAAQQLPFGGAVPAASAQQAAGRWASLPHLQYVHAVHPASDISLLLQSTLTPQLSHLGFVTRGPSDFARLLGQHGKLRTLHLAFAEEESWHPIAVVRLPTALPSLRSLTIDGSFWLPNSLIVALGVMEVPLEHLSLTCKLAPPCLQRLQHLKRLKRLALHHVPSAAGGKGGASANDTMLQLPAKLLPPQLQELEISNGWILH